MPGSTTLPSVHCTLCNSYCGKSNRSILKENGAVWANHVQETDFLFLTLFQLGLKNDVFHSYLITIKILLHVPLGIQLHSG